MNIWVMSALICAEQLRILLDEIEYCSSAMSSMFDLK